MAVSDVPLGYLRRTAAENLPPPIAHTGILGWLRANLLSSPANVVLTVICTSLIIWVLPPLLRFLLIDAVWSGSDRTACLATAANPEPGACWAFVRRWFGKLQQVSDADVGIVQQRHLLGFSEGESRAAGRRRWRRRRVGLGACRGRGGLGKQVNRTCRRG